MHEIRPMLATDVEAVHAVAAETFAELDERLRRTSPAPANTAAAHLRLRHIVATDPGGSWVAEDGQGLAGAALAVLRDGIWGLSLLVVRPERQSAGVGGALLARALAYGADARGAIILASPDPRALRAYARAGFALHPAITAVGHPDGVTAAPDVRPFTAADHPLAAAVDRRVRGAPHGADLDVLAAAGCELLTYPDRGYAAHRDGAVKLIAAFDDEAAAALLRTVLARMPATATTEVEWLTGDQQWAIDVALEARLELCAGGAVFLRGETGAFRPYLPSGAYL